MNIQIFGTSKCFDTKKAQRYFKERGVKFQMIDLKEKEMSRGEFDNVARALGGWEKLVNPKAKDKQTLALLDALVDWQKEDKLFENQQLFLTPIVRNGRQALGLLVAILVVVGFVTVLRAGVGAVANLFDDTAQKQEYEDKLEGLVLFDPMPFDGIENIDDLTLREAAVWGCIYSIQETQGGFDNYNTDPDTEQLLLPSLDVDAYLAKLLGPGFKLTHRSFEMEDMTIEFDDATQCYKIPVTGTVGYYRAVVTKLFKRSGKLHVTVGYIPTASDDDSIINVSSDTPTKYMDYLFERQSGSWYLTGLTESETKAESTDSTSAANLPEPMAESDVQDAILAAAGSDAADSAASAVEPEAQAENGADSAVTEAPAADDAASTAG